MSGYETPEGWGIAPEQRQEILTQIGRGNVLSISGGRVKALVDGVELPVSSGYKVRVRLTPLDLYVVQRVLVRGAKEYPKGERSAVYAENVGDVAYRAGMFQSYDETEW